MFVRIPAPNFSANKLIGPGKNVQVDETMINYKVRSYSGRSPDKRTDALYILDVANGIARVYAYVIRFKRAKQTLI